MKTQTPTKEKLTDKIYRHKDLFAIMAVMITACIWIHGEVKHQDARTDRLYEMFIDIQKEIKDVYVYVAKEKK